MNKDNDILGVGKLSESANTLIIKISDAIGVAYEPTRMKRKAKAEIEIQKLQALANIELEEITQRAVTRLLRNETRKQENIETIADMALEQLNETTDIDKLDNDWLIMFFEKAEKFSDSDIRLLWSRILANEVNNAGAFSRKTLEIVSVLSKVDAELFTKICQFTWLVNQYPCLIIFDLDEEYFSSKGINYDSVQHLVSLGLLTTEPMGLHQVYKQASDTLITYFDKQLNIKFPHSDTNHLPIGMVQFTRSGEELFKIANPQVNEDFYLKTVKKYFGCSINGKFGPSFRDQENSNLIISSPFPRTIAS